MPAQRFDFIGSIPGATAASSPSEVPYPVISFTRCDDNNPSPPFESTAAAVEVIAQIQWYVGEGAAQTATNVQGFTTGDIYVVTEDNPDIEDKIRAGQANRGGAAIIGFGPILGSDGSQAGLYNLTLKLNPNSSGTVWVTVQAGAAGIIPNIADGGTTIVYGPPQPVTNSFSYSTLSGVPATSTKPEVDIRWSPDQGIVTAARTTITLDWNEDIRQRTSSNTRISDLAIVLNSGDLSVGTTGVSADNNPFSFSHIEVTLDPNARRNNRIISATNQVTITITGRIDAVGAGTQRTETLTFSGTGPENSETTTNTFGTIDANGFKTNHVDTLSVLTGNFSAVEVDENADISIVKSDGARGYVAGSFTHNATDASEMTFDVTTSGVGTITIIVHQDKFQDVAGDSGPPEDHAESFLYDTTIPPEGPLVPGYDVIYDSNNSAFDALPAVFGTDGVFKGVSDLTLIGDYFYATVQIQDATNGTTLAQGARARAVLVRVRNQQNTTNISAIQSYNSITDSARSITEVGDRIYFFEGSHPDAGTGYLKSIPTNASSSTPSNHGITWRSRLFNPNAISREDNITYSIHRRMSSPMVGLEDHVYLHSGYGHIRGIKSTDWESSEVQEGLDAPETRIDNWTLLRYGSTIDFRPPVVQTNNRTGYDVIRELAELCFCYIGFDGDTFIFRPKFQPRAKLASDIRADDPTTSIAYKDINMEFPSSGILRIKEELFTYGGKNETSFTSVMREQFGTSDGNYCEDTFIEYIHHIIDMEYAQYREGPINELTSRQDLQQLYNIIRVSYGDVSLDQEEVAKDQFSIDANKPRELELTLPLSHHESGWASWLADQYLQFYGKTRYILNVQLKPSFYIKVGEFVFLRETNSSLIDNKVFQVLNVTHQINPYITNLQLREITRST